MKNLLLRFGVLILVSMDTIMAIPPPDPPVLMKSKQVGKFAMISAIQGDCKAGDTKYPVTIKWTAADRALYYDLYEDGGDGTNPTKIIGRNLTKTTFTKIYTKPGKHEYWVLAKKTTAVAGEKDVKGNTIIVVDAVYSSDPKSAVFCTIQSCGLGSFSITSIVASCEGTPKVTIRWTASSGATMYDVYQDGIKIPGGSNVGEFFYEHYFAKTPATTTCGAKLTTHTYHVVAKNDDIKPLTSTSASKTSYEERCLPLEKFDLKFIATCKNGQTLHDVDLFWLLPGQVAGSVNNACYYDVYKNNALILNNIQPVTYGISPAKNHRLNLVAIPLNVTATFYVVALSGKNGNKRTATPITYTQTKCPLSNARIEAEEFAGITLENNSTISIFPNPTTGEFSLNMDSLSTTHPIGVSLFDLSGKGVFETQLSPESSPKINIAHLPPGTYLVNIATNGKQYHQKIIKD